MRELRTPALLALIPVCLALTLPAFAQANATVDSAVGPPLVADPEPPPLSADALRYLELIAEVEDRDGPFSPALREHLLSLGMERQRAGDHAGAIELFRRGAHLARVNDGLYSIGQIAPLRAEIISLIALGDYEEADGRQRYLFRVQQRTLSSTSRAQAIIRQAQWERRAYHAGLGEEPHQHLLEMSRLYQIAAAELARSEGPASPARLAALYGVLRAQYLLSGVVVEPKNDAFGVMDTRFRRVQDPMIYRRLAFSHGEEAIRAIGEVRMASESGVRAYAEPKLLHADWLLFHGKRQDAYAAYAELERELAERDDAQDVYAEFFGQPQPLPALGGVRSVPDPAENPEGKLLLEFGVTARGRVVDLARLDEEPANDEKASNIMRRLRQTLFRPRISDGMPVDTAGLVVAYDISAW